MEKMNDLRKGKSAVKEWNHTLLIGWTDRSIAFISQVTYIYIRSIFQAWLVHFLYSS